MPNSDSESDISVGYQSSFYNSKRKAHPSSTSSTTRTSTTIRSSARVKKQKVDVITIDDSDDSDFALSEDDLVPSGMGLLERLKKRGGLKTTGLTSDAADESYSNLEEKKDDGGAMSRGRGVSKPARRGTVKCQVGPEKDSSTYLRDLKRSVQKRSFPLSQIPTRQVISTGRTIKTLKAWKGFWPSCREFLQNTVDHLSLMDGKTGKRRDCLTVDATKSDKDKVSTIAFKCENQNICKFSAKQNELVIEQQYTYPIASRSLDTGVVDTSKISGSNQAGGFGDGFKTAAVALLANAKGNDVDSLEWKFYALEEEIVITWSFEGQTKDAIGTFAKCEVLQVVIDKKKMSSSEKNLYSMENNSPYVMQQIIKVKNVGKLFLDLALPMFSVFWELDESSLLSTLGKNSRGLGGDFIGPSLTQPDILFGTFGSIKPKPGIYVRGIWVRPSKIKDVIMSFFGNRLEVTGRDRNEVNDEELIQAFVYVLHGCNNMNYLEELLAPLRLSTDSSAKTTKQETSWLLKSPAFFNRVIECQREFILHDIMNIDRGAIFISNKTLKSKDPFVNWASQFLQSNGMPLVPLGKGANKYLFDEVNEYQMTERCVQVMKEKNKGEGRTKGGSQTIFRNFLQFLGIGKCKVIFSKDIGVAFIHDTNLYIPEAQLSRELIIRVLNVCHSRVEGVLPNNYSSLLESILTCMKGGEGRECSLEIAKRVVEKAKRIKTESAKFLRTNANVSLKSDIVEVHLEDGADPIATSSSDSKSNLERLIQETMQRKSTPVHVGGGTFDKDNAGLDDCIRPSSQMSHVKVDDILGGGSIFCDETTATSVRQNSFDVGDAKKLASIRIVLKDAISITRNAIPSIRRLLDNICEGYDADNDSYEAFFDGERIVINLYAFLSKVGVTRKRSLVLDLVTVITHELAHALLPEAGHGPDWRNCHMNMIVQIMHHLEI